jgi:hypothetical protein
LEPKDRRSLTPLGSRVIERRTRSRASYGADELLPFLLLRDGLLSAGRGLGSGIATFLRRLSLAGRPPLHGLPADLGSSAGPVRLRGEVEVIVPGFESPGSKQPVVFARSLFLNQPRPGHPRSLSDEMRGVDFRLRLPSGERVEVAAADVRLDARPARIPRPNLEELHRRGGDMDPPLLAGLGGLAGLVREANLRPGDTVEALGVLVRQVNPGGDAVTGRGTPLVTRLVPGPGERWLWIQRAT